MRVPIKEEVCNNLEPQEQEFIKFLYETIPDGNVESSDFMYDKEDRAIKADERLKLDEVKAIASLCDLQYKFVVEKKGYDATTDEFCIKKPGEITDKGIKDRFYRVTYNEKAVEILKQIISNYATTPQDGKQKTAGKTKPVLFRKIVYFVVYNTLRSCFGETHHKDWGVIDIDAQDAILKQLDLDDKSFQSWGMSPVYDFFSAMNVPKYMGLYRAGKKRDSLLFIISDLVDSMKPKRFYDVFGGTGAVSLAMSPKDYEVLNEYDICLFNFLVCVKYYPDELWEKCKKLTAEIIDHDYKKHVMYWNTWDYLFKKGKNGKHLVEEEDLAIAFHFKLLNFVYDFLYKFNIAEGWKGRGKAPVRYYDVLKNYKSTILGIEEPLKDTILPVIFNGMLEIAAHWYFLYSFSQQGYSEPSITVYRYEGFITWLDIIGAEIDEEAFAKISCSLPAFSDIEDEKNDYIDMNIRSKHIIYKDEDKEKLDLFMVSKRLQSVDLISSDFHAVLNDADSYWVKTGNIGGNKSYGVSGKFASVIDSYKCDCLSAKGWERKILPTEVEATPTSLGIKAMQSVISKPEETLVYLDPPYFMTEQYDSAFPDKLHVDMIEWLRTTKCNWILSCKEDCTNEDEKGTIQSYRVDGGVLIKEFKDFFIGLARWFEIVEKKKIKGVDVDIIRGFRTGDILEGLYVYRELPCINSKTVDEIMIANFKIQEEATLDTFYLYWDKAKDRANIKSEAARKRAISGVNAKQKAYECIPFEDFLKSKGWY